MAPSLRRKPAASSRSYPGVRMTTATLLPSTRISNGSAAATASGLSPDETTAPDECVKRWRITDETDDMPATIAQPARHPNDCSPVADSSGGSAHGRIAQAVDFIEGRVAGDYLHKPFLIQGLESVLHRDPAEFVHRRVDGNQAREFIGNQNDFH